MTTPDRTSGPLEKSGTTTVVQAAMRYLTAAGVGVLTAISAAILWIVVWFVLPLVVPLVLSRFGATSGSGGVGAVIGSGSILLAALFGFVGGFGWMVWRG
jgi:hypothetical protein